MKILLLNYEYPPLGGGAGVISQHIAEGLATNGHQLTVLTTWFNGEEERSVSFEGRLQLIRLKSKRKSAHRSNVSEMLSWIRQSWEFLKSDTEEGKYDLVFANFALPGGEVACRYGRKHGIPFVILSHGHDIPWFFPKQMFWYHLLTWPRILSICRASAALFVQSGDMMSNAQRFLGKRHHHKVHLIHNGADFRAFFPDYSHRSKDFLILFAGRLVKQKGPMFFLKALFELNRSGINWKARIIGDGPMKSEMEAFVDRNGLNEKVSFDGWLGKEKIAEAYRQAWIMVAPSLNEGMSIAMNEALASGLYVFTTPVSCNENIVIPGVNGEIVPVGQASELAEKIQKFACERFIQDYKVPSDVVQNFLNSYHWPEIIEKYEMIFNQLTDQ